MKMKAIQLSLTFAAGALTLWLITPSYKPVAELIIWTSVNKITIPLSKQDSAPFLNTGTNQLVIQGISVNKL